MKNKKQNKKRIAGVSISIIIFMMTSIIGITLTGCQSTGGGATYKSDQTDRINEEEDRKEPSHI